MSIEDHGTDKEILSVRKKHKKIIAIFISLLVVMIIIPVLSMTYGLIKLGDYMCDNNELLRESNEKQDIDLIMYERNCGATTGFSYHLSVIDQGKKQKNTIGNIYISDEKYDVEWRSNRSIAVKVNGGDEFKKIRRYKDITVYYE